MQSELFTDTQNNPSNAKTYAEFKADLLAVSCCKCSLGETRQHIVVERGNPAAGVVIIGEAPGKNEDVEGRAFVGRAGRLLDQMLTGLGFDTNRDSLIVNVVKCRPPGNRPPNPHEVEACTPYLKKQLELVRPKILLLLGATALRHVIKGKMKFSMASEVGKFFEDPNFAGVKIMVMFHPAYILRDPRKKPLMIEHLRKFVEQWKATVP